MKKLSYIITFLLVLTVVSCKKEFFDINKNPNDPTEGDINPNVILPGVLHATAEQMAINYDYAAQWTGYWARSGSYGQNLPQENYAITTDYQQVQWRDWYNILQDVNVMQKKAIANNQPFYNGVAKVLKSIGYMYLVDQYNNVPYTETFDIDKFITPKYDKGADIYKDLLKQLDEAAAIFKAAGLTTDPSIKAADILFKGDGSKWLKLANTQKLKLIIRQSQVPGFNANTEIAKITANGGGYLMAGESASVQPGYVGDNLKQNPFYNAYKLTYIGAVADTYNRANNFVLDLYRDNDDIRYTYFFSKAETPIPGNIYYGYNFGENLPNTTPFVAVSSSDVGGPGLAKSPTQPQWLFTSVESLFLQAEAVERGWLPGSGLTALQSAVTESFVWLGVPDATAEAGTYLAGDFDIVDYATASNKINFIATQKYLALTGINNFEAYVDYRRLGVPEDLPLSIAESVGSNVIPKRLLYPSTEYSYNPDNVKAEGAINAQTSTIFWDK